MSAEKGYYSIIQYCPDLWRGEAANVGVVMFQPGSGRMDVKLSETLARVRHFFKPDERQMAFITDAARAVRVRLTTRAADFKTVQDLAEYAGTMGNDMRLTPPRVTAVTETNADLIRLFDKLVGSEAQGRRPRPAVVLPSAINQAFEELKRSNRLFAPGRIVVPILGRRLDIPYAYRNGVLNLIKPTVFENHREVEDRAIRLAVEGDFLRENPPVEEHDA